MNNAVLTTIGNEGFAQQKEVQVFLNTAKANVDGDICIFYFNLLPSTILSYQHRGFVTIEIPPIITNSYLWYYQFLCQTNYQNILCCDSKDVLFQKNPFDTPTNNKLSLVSEGMMHGPEIFNKTDHQVLEESMGFQYDLTNKQVINASVYYGQANLVKDFLLLLYLLMLVGRSQPTQPPPRTLQGYTEQGMLNFIYHMFLCYNPNYQLKTPDIDSFCAHGLAFPEMAIINYGLEFNEDELLYNPYNEQIFTMIHQWQTPTKFKQRILNKYA